MLPFRIRMAPGPRLALNLAIPRLVYNRANPLRKDPTRTTGIRNRFLAEMKARFARLKAHVKEFMVTQDALGLGEQKNPFLNASPREFQFRTDPGKMTAFQEWLNAQIKADILSVSPGASLPSMAQGPWTAKYVESAYKQGQLNAYLATRSALSPTDPNFISESQAEFMRSSFNQPETLSKIELLATRSYEDLKGVTAQMGSNMNRILAQGLVDGSGPDEIAKSMTQTIDGLTDTRALVIARTETIYAHAEGQLDAFTQLGVTELGVKAEWSTAGDDRVCPECADMEGQVFDIEEARGLIPLHPNCRCSWIPATEPDLQQAGRLGDIEGNSVVSIIRRAGEQGMDFGETKALLDRAGIPAADQTIRIQLRAGRTAQGTLAPQDLLDRIKAGTVRGVPPPIVPPVVAPVPVVPPVRPPYVRPSRRRVPPVAPAPPVVPPVPPPPVPVPLPVVRLPVPTPALPPEVGERFVVGHLKGDLLDTGSLSRSELVAQTEKWRLEGVTIVDGEVAAFQKEFGMTPLAFKNQMLQGLDEHKVRLHIFKSGDDWKFIGKDTPAAFQRNRIDFTRVYYPKEKRIYNELFEVAADLQEKGLAKQLTRNSLPLWDHLGIKRIDLHANIDVGGYSWARYGFVPNQADWDALRQRTAEKFISQSTLAEMRLPAKFGPKWDPGSRIVIPDAVHAQLKIILESSDPKAIRALAALNHEVTPLRGAKAFKPHSMGKESLLGSNWHGAIELNSPQDYAILRDYIGLKPRAKDPWKTFQDILDKPLAGARGLQLKAYQESLAEHVAAKRFVSAATVQRRIDTLLTEDFHAALKANREGVRHAAPMWSGQKVASAALRERQEVATEWLRDTVASPLLKEEASLIQFRTPDQRAFYRSLSRELHLDKSDDAGVLVHEFGHHLQRPHTGIFEREKDFLLRRAGPNAKRNNAIHGNVGEVGYDDRFKELGGSDYTGRTYNPNGLIQDKKWTAGEITSMGVERLYRSPAEFYRNDPEYFKWIVDNIQRVHK